MSRSWKRALAILLLTTLVVIAGLATLAWFALPLDGTSITVDGERFSLAALGGTNAAVVFAIAVAVVVSVVIAAIVAGAIGLGAGAAGLAFGAIVAVGTLALVAAPFVLAAALVWLLWRIARGRPAPQAARP